MAGSETPLAQGCDVDMEMVIARLAEEFRPPPWEPLCKAIRCGDMRTICSSGLELRGATTGPPKEAAILAGRSDILELLLRRDAFVDEEVV